MKKGTVGYLKQLKRKYMWGIIIAGVFLLIQTFMKNYTQELISRYLTIGMGIAIIPIGLYLAKLIASWSYKQEDFIVKSYEENPSIYEHTLMELIIVNGKQSYFVNGFFYANERLYVYSSHHKLTVDILKEIFRRKVIEIELIFIQDQREFLQKINEAKEMPEPIRRTLLQIST